MTDIKTHLTSFSGDAITPGDTTYDMVRSTYMATGSPLAVLRPRTTDDITEAIRYATSKNVPLSVRSGGHSGMGHSTNDGGIVVDMKYFSGIEILDKAKGIVRIGAGARWGDVANELAGEGLVVSAGDTKSVGVGGLTLGGGIGIMVRKYGLAIDQLVGAEVVTADGRVLQASLTENADLFWALRGGGGNFGVVTHLDFAAHPLGDVHFGPITYKLDNLGELLRGWRDATRKSPREVTTTLVIMPGFGGTPPSAMMLYCFAGDDTAANEAALAPFLAAAPVISQEVTRMPYAEALQEAHAPAGVVPAVKDGLIRTLSDETIATLAAIYQDATDKMMFLRSLGGAVTDHADDETAFSHRSSEVLLVCAAFMPQDIPVTAKDSALDFFDQTIAPLTDGAYSNFFTTYTSDDFARMYPQATLERLRAAKRRYDPHNVFSRNFNVTP